MSFFFWLPHCLVHFYAVTFKLLKSNRYAKTIANSKKQTQPFEISILFKKRKNHSAQYPKLDHPRYLKAVDIFYTPTPLKTYPPGYKTPKCKICPLIGCKEIWINTGIVKEKKQKIIGRYNEGLWVYSI